MNHTRFSLRRLVPALFLLIIPALTAVPPCLAETEIWAFYRSDIPLYIAVMKQLEAHLKRQLVSCPIEKTSSSFIDSHSPKMAIALGDAGLKRALTMTWNVPILAAFVDELPADTRVVDIDVPQPHQRQIELLMKLRPDLKTIWYPFAGEAFAPTPALTRAAATAGLKLVADRLQDPRVLPRALRVLDNQTTATILPPDPGIMNDAIISPVMLAAFRSQTVVVGFSEGIAKQGAAFAYVLNPHRLVDFLVDHVEAYGDGNRPRGHDIPFDNWDLILNVTILDKLQLSPSAEIRNLATKEL